MELRQQRLEQQDRGDSLGLLPLSLGGCRAQFGNFKHLEESPGPANQGANPLYPIPVLPALPASQEHSRSDVSLDFH